MLNQETCQLAALPSSISLPLSLLDEQEWEGSLQCRINPNALARLLRDNPEKRRKVYFEMMPSSQHQLLLDLENAGFDMGTMKRQRVIQPQALNRQEGFSCLITGTVNAILRFLYKNPQVILASVDFPEYSWLSSNPDRSNHLPEASLPAS